jgi:hypothetical protein
MDLYSIMHQIFPRTNDRRRRVGASVSPCVTDEEMMT